MIYGMVDTNPNEGSEPVLIVDDEQDIRELLSAALKERGFNVLTAEGGRQAYELLVARTQKTGSPAIKAIISDWMMPGGDGIEFLNRVRAGDFRGLPFILMSGGVTREELNSAAQHDPDVILLKPFRVPTLLAKLQEAIQRRENKEVHKLLREIPG